MGVRIVILTHQHARGLRPLVIGVTTDVLSSWLKALILLAAQQRGQIVVQPATPIVTGVNDHCLLLAATSQEGGIDLPEALAVHTSHMHIANLSTGELIDRFLAMLDPTLVEQLPLIALADRLHLLLKAATRSGIVDG